MNPREGSKVPLKADLKKVETILQLERSYKIAVGSEDPTTTVGLESPTSF
jgi:hypothetical protein